MAFPPEPEIEELLRAAIGLRCQLAKLPWELLDNRPDLAHAERRLDLAIEAVVSAAS